MARCIYPELFVFVICITLFLPVFDSFAGTIQGSIIDEEGNYVAQALLVLYNKTKKTDYPQITFSDSEGKFIFNLEDFSQLYHLIIYSNGNIFNKTLDYRGRNIKLNIKTGQKWYKTWWFDKIWELIFFLLTFCFGIFFREIVCWIKINKTQESITVTYKKLFYIFENEYKKMDEITISMDNKVNEQNYLPFMTSFKDLKEYLEKLLYFNLLVENVGQIFYEEIWDSLLTIHRIENTILFREDFDFDHRLSFLKNHQKKRWETDNKEHINFNEFLNNLRNNFKNCDFKKKTKIPVNIHKHMGLMLPFFLLCLAKKPSSTWQIEIT